jgi:phage shock protein A
MANFQETLRKIKQNTIQKRIDLKKAEAAKSKKVELALTDDIKDTIQKLQDVRELVDDALTEYYNTISKIQNDFADITTDYSAHVNLYEQLQEELDRLERGADDLGLNADDVPAFVEGKAAIKRADDLALEFLEANRLFKTIEQNF